MARQKSKRRDEHLQHAPQLVARDERAGRVLLRFEKCDAEAPQRGAGEDDAEVERQVAALRTVLRPAHPAAPVVEAEDQRQREQQQIDDHLDGALVVTAESSPAPVGRLVSVRRCQDRSTTHLACSRMSRSFPGTYFSTKPASCIRPLFSLSSCFEEGQHVLAGEEDRLERLLLHVVLVLRRLRHLLEQIDVEGDLRRACTLPGRNMARSIRYSMSSPSSLHVGMSFHDCVSVTLVL